MLTHSNTSSSVVKDRDLHIMTTVAHQAAAVKLAILEENLENKNELVTHTPHRILLCGIFYVGLLEIILNDITFLLLTNQRL